MVRALDDGDGVDLHVPEVADGAEHAPFAAAERCVTIEPLRMQREGTGFGAGELGANASCLPIAPGCGQSHRRARVRTLEAVSDHPLVGKTLLVGITYVDALGEVTSRRELWGRVVRVDEQVLTMELDASGDEFTLPWDPDAYRPAPPGRYRLRTTGEVADDPELIATWTVQSPPVHH
jgi:hypothetical protein